MLSADRRASSRGFASWPPFAKLALGGVSATSLAVLIQSVRWLRGGQFDLIETSAGRSGLLAVGVLTLLYLIVWDRRSLASCGLVIDAAWRRQLLAGMLVGAGFFGGYYLLAWSLGVYSLQSVRMTTGRWLLVPLSVLQAMPLAAMQQLVFSGYLPSMLRDRHNRFVSALVPSLVFGVFGGLSALGGPASLECLQLTIGMTLVSCLLCLVRWVSGSLSLSVGLLAGAIMMRRVVRHMGWLLIDPQNPWASWFAPSNDPRQGWPMWAALLAAIGLASVVLWRKGEPNLPAFQPALDASFKRVLPFTNLLALAPLDLWVAKLIEARGRVGLQYVPRLIVTLLVSTLNTLLSLPERFLAPWLLRHAIPDPVFIVGIHRSGTTHLHNLLSLDSRFSTPRSYQVFNPHGFLSGVFTTALLGPLLTWRRPMDSVQMTVFSPQEEEFALAAMCRCSPYWFGCFPKLFDTHERFIYPERMTDRERATWRRNFTLFLRKLTFWSRRRPLLKSPYNTARVGMLRDFFPTARFVHIVREPHAVYRSNMHLAEHGWAIFQLQDPEPIGSYADRFLRNYRDQELAYERDVADLPDHCVSEVRFEDLERDPIGEVRRIYAELELEFTPQFESRLREYVGSVADYQKNRYRPPADADRRKVDDLVGDLAKRWGYAEPQRDAARAA